MILPTCVRAVSETQLIRCRALEAIVV